MARQRGESGQASVELIAAIPALALVTLLVAQLALAGYALWSAGVAARAGARAAYVGGNAGRPALAAVREALPGWARDRVGVEVDGGRLTVRLQPPSPLGAIARRLELSSSAWVRRPEDR